MYIIVIGGGKIGYHLAKSLLVDSHEVLILERDRLRADRLTKELGNMILRGDGCEAVTLEKAGAARADVVIATTGEDEDNLVACQVARHKFDVVRTVCIVNDPRNEALFQKLGVSVTVSATQIILSNIEYQLPENSLLPLASLDKAGYSLVTVGVPKNSRVIGKRLGDINVPKESIISMVINSDYVPHLPDESLVIGENDQIIALAMIEHQDMLRAVFTNGTPNTRND